MGALMLVRGRQPMRISSAALARVAGPSAQGTARWV
jgi:hypothetical protein